MAQVDDDAPLTADDVLTFGPIVEAQVWTPVWLQEARAPIAVTAGRAKLKQVFDDQGVGKAIVIRPCMSRGARIRGLPPIYTPQMLEKHANVFDGWPMFMNHAPAAVQEALAKKGRSVTELGGQLLKGSWRRDLVHEDDATYGYQKGAVVADIWATPMVRAMVAENANLLHTSINAWPTSGKPGSAPWRSGVKGMVIEGIRRQPQGSVDFVVRGGAGGRLLVAEGLEDEGAWPEVGEWDAETTRFVVSLAESVYAAPQMTEIVLPTKPTDLKDWLVEHAPHLVPALDGPMFEAKSDDEVEVAKLMKAGLSMTAAWAKVKAGGKATESETEPLTEAQVRQILAESNAGQPTAEEFTVQLEERVQEMLAERESTRTHADRAREMITAAEGILPGWKKQLLERYAVAEDGSAPLTLLAEADTGGKDGAARTPLQVLEARVTDDLERTRDLIAEAQGKPRVRGEGGAARGSGGDGKRTPAGGKRTDSDTPHWRTRFTEMGLAESEDKAVELFGATTVQGS